MPETITWLDKFKINSPRKMRAAGDRSQREQNWSKSVQYYQKYLDRRPNDNPIWVQLGHALKELKRFDEAETAYRRALQASPNDDDALLHLATLLRSSVKNTGAKALEPISNKILRTLHKEDKLDLHSVIMTSRDKGDAARDRQDWYHATLYYSEYLDESPDDGAIWVQIGHMLKEQSLFEEALYAYRVGENLETEPSDVSLHISFLLMHMKHSVHSEPLWAKTFKVSEG